MWLSYPAFTGPVFCFVLVFYSLSTKGSLSSKEHRFWSGVSFNQPTGSWTGGCVRGLHRDHKLIIRTNSHQWSHTHTHGQNMLVSYRHSSMHTFPVFHNMIHINAHTNTHCAAIWVKRQSQGNSAHQLSPAGAVGGDCPLLCPAHSRA